MQQPNFSFSGYLTVEHLNFISTHGFIEFNNITNEHVEEHLRASVPERDSVTAHPWYQRYRANESFQMDSGNSTQRGVSRGAYRFEAITGKLIHTLKPEYGAAQKNEDIITRRQRSIYPYLEPYVFHHISKKKELVIVLQ